MLSDARLNQLATTLADQLALLYEVRPADPQVSLDGNTLTFAFHGGLTDSDELLIHGGRQRELRDFREEFLQATSARLSEIVSSFTGSVVVFFSAAFDPGSRTTTSFFTLATPVEPQSEPRRAIRNWSERVWRNARGLRAQHIRVREQQRCLRKRLQRPKKI